MQAQSRLAGTPMTLDSLKNLQYRLFRENTDRINGLCFSDCGNWMVTSANDDSLVLYDLSIGRKQRKVNFPKTGVHDVQFLHSTNDVILAGRKRDTNIRHFSLHNNTCIRFFKGHDKPVSHLVVSPDDDLFMSSAADQSVRLWDVRMQSTLAVLHLDYTAFTSNIAFDPEGLIFAVTTGSECIKLFDKRMYNNGPFSTFDLSYVHDSTWTNISFSPDGKSILIVTDGNHLRLVESYEGAITNTLSGHSNENRLPLRASFTPCSKYILCGGSDGTITFWLTETGKTVYKLKADHLKPIQIVDFNPRYHMLASTCNDTKLWTPNFDYYRRLSISSFGMAKNLSYR